MLSERGDGELDKFLLDYDIRNTCKYAVKLLLDGDVHAPPTTGGGASLSLANARSLPWRSDCVRFTRSEAQAQEARSQQQWSRT